MVAWAGSPVVEVPDLIAVLADAGRRLGDAATACSLDDAVPTCVGWTVRDLVHHVGGVHRWATSYVLEGKALPSRDEDARYFAQVPDAELVSWYCQGHGALVAALSAADPAMTCWTFLPAPSPLAFWTRRQAHETAVHCADAEASARWPSEFPIDFALDGIDELLNGFFARPKGRLVADPPVALAIRPIDADLAWTIRIEGDRRTVSPGVGQADCLITGRSSDLYLLLWNRAQPGHPVDVTGDHRVMELWTQKAQV